MLLRNDNRKEKELRVFAIANQKGGCGKTTTAINLAASLAECEKSVLLIDLDPQAHSTLGLGIDPEKLEKSLSNVLNEEPGKAFEIEDVLVRVCPRLDLAPSQIFLSAFEQRWAGVEGREDVLYRKLQPLGQLFDFVLIDCPPNIGLLTFNALRAADDVLVPVEPSFFSLHGLKKLVETVGLVEDTFSKQIALRALLTLWDPRTILAREVWKKFVSHFAGKVYTTYIRKNNRLQQAVEAGKPITLFDPDAAGSKDYKALAKELLELEAKEVSKTLVDEIEREAVLMAGKAQELPQRDKQQEVGRAESPEEAIPISPEKKTAGVESGEGFEREGVQEAGVEEETVKERQVDSIDRVYEEIRTLPEEEVAGTKLQAEENVAVGQSDSSKVEALREAEEAEVVFSYLAPTARNVEIIGDFTDWQALRLNPPPGSQGVWMKIFHLRKGAYQYKFLVDGKKTIDLKNPRFGVCPQGGIASIIEV